MTNESTTTATLQERNGHSAGSPASTADSPPVNKEEQAILLALASKSIHYGLRHGRSLEVSTESYSRALREKRVTFVTLHFDGKLRGCIGTLEAHRPLVNDVAENAYAAAFRDYRFSPIANDEAQQLQLHISILSPPQPLTILSEQDLLAQLRPSVDGVILEEDEKRATFLPAVWETLPDPKEFIRHLKQKAGMADNYWSKRIKISLYQSFSFS